MFGEYLFWSALFLLKQIINEHRRNGESINRKKGSDVSRARNCLKELTNVTPEKIFPHNSGRRYSGINISCERALMDVFNYLSISLLMENKMSEGNTITFGDKRLMLRFWRYQYVLSFTKKKVLWKTIHTIIYHSSYPNFFNIQTHQFQTNVKLLIVTHFSPENSMTMKNLIQSLVFSML